MQTSNIIYLMNLLYYFSDVFAFITSHSCLINRLDIEIYQIHSLQYFKSFNKLQFLIFHSRKNIKKKYPIMRKVRLKLIKN